MSSSTERGLSAPNGQGGWTEAIAKIEAELKKRKAEEDAATAHLNARLDVQIAVLEDLRAEIEKLSAQIASTAGAARVKLMATIDELKAQGDEAYELLLASMQTKTDAPHVKSATNKKRESKRATADGDTLVDRGRDVADRG
jgi:hypothetical protein